MSSIQNTEDIMLYSMDLSDHFLSCFMMKSSLASICLQGQKLHQSNAVCLRERQFYFLQCICVYKVAYVNCLYLSLHFHPLYPRKTLTIFPFQELVCLRIRNTQGTPKTYSFVSFKLQLYFNLQNNQGNFEKTLIFDPQAGGQVKWL